MCCKVSLTHKNRNTHTHTQTIEYGLAGKNDNKEIKLSPIAKRTHTLTHKQTNTDTQANTQTVVYDHGGKNDNKKDKIVSNGLSHTHAYIHMKETVTG